MATTNTTPPTGQCAVCKEPASKRCSRCAEGLDVDGVAAPTLYCSVDCQKADFPTHKAICRSANARKQLYRGGELLQKVLYAYKEVAFDYDICHIRKDGNDIHLWDFTMDFTKGPLFPFPNNKSLSTDDKKAILTFLGSGDEMAYFHALMGKVMQGIVGSSEFLKEAGGIVKGMKRTMWLHGPDGSMNSKTGPHVVLAATLTNGEAYVVDVSGAQHSQYRAVTPLKRYEDTHVDKLMYREFGHGAKGAKRLFAGEWKPTPGADHRAYIVHKEIAASMYEAVAKWEADGNNIVSLLKDTQTNFEARTACFVEFLTTAMDVCVKSWKARPGVAKEATIEHVPSNTSASDDGEKGQGADQPANGIDAAGSETVGSAPSSSDPAEKTLSDHEREAKEELARLIKKFDREGHTVFSMAGNECRTLSYAEFFKCHLED